MKPGSALEGELVERYVPLVKNVVGRLAMTLPPHVDGEDLYSAGLTGLLSAVRQYNPNAGTSFETYARLRIRGAVFDELRRMDWVPRSVHTKARKVQAVMNLIEQKKGRMATEQEMADGLKISLPDYHQWLEEIRPATFVCLDAAFNHDFDDSVSQYESLPDHRQEDPLDGTFRREMARVIAERLREGPSVRPAQSRRQLALGGVALATGQVDGRALRFHRRDGPQDRRRFPARDDVLLGLQQSEHLAVLLQFVAKCFNDLFENGGHRSVIGRSAPP